MTYTQSHNKIKTEARTRKGPSSTEKTTGEILRKNIFTLFNGLNALLALAVILFADIKNAMFMGVVICNAAIGIIQELRAKKLVDKLCVITAPKAKVIRGEGEPRDGDGEPRDGDGVPAANAAAGIIEIPIDDIELGDILYVETGDQICADSTVISGFLEVDESLLTGESDLVRKQAGDTLYSGSFVASGSARAQVNHVGSDNYAAKITEKIKVMKKPKSEIITAVNKIIKVVAIAILPIGAALFIKEFLGLKLALDTAVTTTVAALIGMIPEGLVLLTSVVLAVGIMRLAKKQALVQELYSIEMLARVDVLCLDKTGTITTGRMQVEEFVPAGDESANVAGDESANVASANVAGDIQAPEYEGTKARLQYAAAAVAYGLNENSPTAKAIRDALKVPAALEITGIVPFSSARKWSGVRVAATSEGADVAATEATTFIMGAPQFVFAGEPDTLDMILPLAQNYAASGRRVLAIASSPEDFNGEELPAHLRFLGFVVISDEIRAGAAKTLSYFKQQGVTIKIISGDDPVTVSHIAAAVGVEGAENYIDTSSISEEELAKIADKYTVFGRVTPSGKLALIQALKKSGHTVAMTGDGVNDVMALRESDCSIAPACGTDAARGVSQIVLLDSDFSSLPEVVAEGRRSINNLQRSSTLFLTKTIFSAILAVVFIFLNASYPLVPIQLTLISALTIGAPSFVLGLQSNREIVKGHFLRNVLSKAVPGALTDIIILVLATLICGASARGYSAEEISTICAMLAAFVGFLVLFKTCVPFDKLRIALFITMAAAYALALIIMPSFFSMAAMSLRILKAVGTFAVIAMGLYAALVFILSRLELAMPLVKKQGSGDRSI